VKPNPAGKWDTSILINDGKNKSEHLKIQVFEFTAFSSETLAIGQKN